MESDELVTKKEGSKDKEAPQKASYAYKLFQTANLGIGQFITGIAVGLGGTTYLDLLQITGSDVQNGSLIFTAAGVGGIVGSVASGPLFKKFPLEAMFAVSLLFTGLLTAVTPWMPDLVYLITVTLAGWIGIALIEAALPLLVTGLWKSKDASFTHALYLCYAVGGIVGPVLAEPFLSTTTTLSGSSLNTSNSIGNSTIALSETRIQVPFFIVGLTYEIIAVVWFGIYVKNRNTPKTYDEDEYESMDKSDNVSQKQQLVVLFLIGLFFTLYDGIENCFHDFLMTFLVKAFGWTKSNGAWALTVFWCGYTGCKVCGVGLAKVISPGTLMLICLAGMNICLSLWIAFCNVYSAISWPMIALIGSFMSVVFPAGISFTNSYQSGISSKMMAWIMTCADIGNTLNPILVGYLMQNASPMTFLYVLIAETAACLCVMLVVAGIVFMPKVRSYTQEKM
ncbi:sodium-dependent glucose transporter 1C-like [Liolophura sinensis]|uniref:sodium-dependent glucose transporter 1C-like n=1 Tax=Liolophura sinensis TaxID=3198878 RepID=UPI003158DE4B